MVVLLNYRKGNERLKQGLEESGHSVAENIWDINEIRQKNIGAAVFEFKEIFKRKARFLDMALRLKKAGIPVVTWNLDSPWNMGIKKWKVNLLLHSRLLDVYATHSLQDTGHIKNSAVLYLPNAALTNQYNLMGKTFEDLRESAFYQWDVSFLGNLDSVRYPEHKERVSFLKTLEKHLEDRGITYLFLDSKNLKPAEQVAMIQKSRINLSSLSAADSLGVKSWGLPERCYGISACGGFALMDDRVHVKDDFIPHVEAAVYHSMEDCVNKIVYYLANNDERRRIAERAYERVMKDHTYRKRAETLIKAACSLSGKKGLR